MYNKTMKIVALSIVFTLIISLSPMSFAANDAQTVNFDLSRQLNHTKILLDEEIEITYKITPNSITGEEPPAKEIFIVMDTSGSMNFDLEGKEIPRRSREISRITIAREAANKFLDKLQGKSGVQVGLISYENLAKLQKNLTTDLGSIKTLINNLHIEGGTNIGDGLRHAYYKLKDSTTERYIILLTDGEPTFHSTYRRYPYSFYTDEGTAPDYRGGGSVITENDMLYCFKIAEDYIKPSGIKSYMIAFSKTANGEVLEDIAQKAGGIYEKAEDAEALDKVYDKISEQIMTDLTVKNVKFKETFPDGLTLVSVSEGFVIDGQSVTGEFEIDYTYNADTNLLEAAPIEFKIKLKGSSAGNYLLDSSKLSYDDLDNSNKIMSFEDKNVEVVALETVLNPERSLSKQEMLIDEQFDVNYEIVPEEFSINAELVPPAELVVKNVSFQEQFPEGLTVVSADGLSISGRNVSGNLGNVVYAYDASVGKYKASPIEFTITLKGEEGEYALGRGSNKSRFTYYDLNKETKDRSFPELNPSIVKFGIPKLEVTAINRRGEVVDIKLKATLPAHTDYGKIMKPVVGTDSDGNTVVTKGYGGDIETINGRNEVYSQEYTYTGLSIYETHRVWLEAVSDFDPATKNSTDIITIFNAIDIN